MPNYEMRGYYTVGGYYTYWLSAGAPDFTGAGSGFPAGDVNDEIVVRRIEGGGVPGDSGGDWQTPGLELDAFTSAAIDLLDNEPWTTGIVTADLMAEHP